MEVHPILGSGDTPQPDLWYVISSFGQYPSMRVGHTITYVPGRDGKSDKLVIVGGANPSGPFAETHILYLDKYEWDELECDGLIGRYEHCAFLPESQPDHVYIFGGADQASNLNDMQMLNLGTEKWSTVSVSGIPPSPRTCRNSAFIGNKLYIFGGGSEGAEPVNDRHVHVFDTESLTWSQPEVKGKVPKSRLGHVMVAVGNKIYLHGGMARDIFYNEVHELNTETMTWKLVRCKGDVPPGCTAHAAVAISNTHFCIQGGMTPSGALDTTYVFDTVNSRWQKVKFGCPPPACRLDHAICLGYLSHPKNNTESFAEPEAKTEDTAASVPSDMNKDDSVCWGNGGRKDSGGASSNTELTCLGPQADCDGTSESQNIVTANVECTSAGCDTRHSKKDSIETEQVMHSACGDSELQSVGQELRKDNVQNSSNASTETTLTIEGDKRVPPPPPQTSGNTDSDTTVDALTSLSIEGAKQNTPTASTTTHDSEKTTVDALSNLLSIEGAKRIFSDRQSASEPAGDVSDRAKSLVCVVHGGMDTGGEIFDDCLVWRVSF